MRIVVFLLPLSRSASGCRCSSGTALRAWSDGLAPDDDPAVVRARREESTELGVGPGNAPHGAGVAFEGVGEAMGVIGLDGEDFDG